MYEAKNPNFALQSFYIFSTSAYPNWWPVTFTAIAHHRMVSESHGRPVIPEWLTQSTSFQTLLTSAVVRTVLVGEHSDVHATATAYQAPSS